MHFELEGPVSSLVHLKGDTFLAVQGREVRVFSVSGNNWKGATFYTAKTAIKAVAVHKNGPYGGQDQIDGHTIVAGDSRGNIDLATFVSSFGGAVHRNVNLLMQASDVVKEAHFVACCQVGTVAAWRDASLALIPPKGNAHVNKLPLNQILGGVPLLDGDSLALNAGNLVAFFDLQKWEVRTIVRFGSGISCMSEDINGRLTVALLDNSILNLGEESSKIAVVQPTYVLAHSTNGLLASGHSDGSIRIWDDTFKLVYLIEGPTEATRALLWLPGDQILVSGGDDGMVRLWPVGKYLRITGASPKSTSTTGRGTGPGRWIDI